VLARGPAIWHKPAMQLFVGVNSHRGSIKRYGFDLLEMPVSPSLPRLKTLRELRTQKPDLRFSLRLHPDSVQLGAGHPDVARAKEATLALGADVIVAPTGPRMTPTNRNREALARTFDALRGGDHHIAWEPRGVWAAEEAERIAEEYGALIVRDLTREVAPSNQTIYTRLLPFGTAARVSQNAVEVLAQNLENAEMAYVVVQSEGAKMLRSQLREWLELEDD
jgi:uncharacterized protein YecE (DUF72 family)